MLSLEDGCVAAVVTRAATILGGVLGFLVDRGQIENLTLPDSVVAVRNRHRFRVPKKLEALPRTVSSLNAAAFLGTYDVPRGLRVASSMLQAAVVSLGDSLRACSDYGKAGASRIAAILSPRIRGVLTSISGEAAPVRYDQQSESSLLTRQTWEEDVVPGLIAIVLPWAKALTPILRGHFVTAVGRIVVKRILLAWRRKRFTRFGAAQLDRDVRSLAKQWRTLHDDDDSPIVPLLIAARALAATTPHEAEDIVATATTRAAKNRQPPPLADDDAAALIQRRIDWE